MIKCRTTGDATADNDDARMRFHGVSSIMELMSVK
jgi:hypothetical protein